MSEDHRDLYWLVRLLQIDGPKFGRSTNDIREVVNRYISGDKNAPMKCRHLTKDAKKAWRLTHNSEILESSLSISSRLAVLDRTLGYKDAYARSRTASLEELGNEICWLLEGNGAPHVELQLRPLRPVIPDPAMVNVRREDVLIEEAKPWRFTLSICLAWTVALIGMLLFCLWYFEFPPFESAVETDRQALTPVSSSDSFQEEGRYAGSVCKTAGTGAAILAVAGIATAVYKKKSCPEGERDPHTGQCILVQDNNGLLYIGAGLVLGTIAWCLPWCVPFLEKYKKYSLPALVGRLFGCGSNDNQQANETHQEIQVNARVAAGSGDDQQREASLKRLPQTLSDVNKQKIAGHGHHPNRKVDNLMERLRNCTPQDQQHRVEELKSFIRSESLEDSVVDGLNLLIEIISNTKPPAGSVMAYLFDLRTQQASLGELPTSLADAIKKGLSSRESTLHLELRDRGHIQELAKIRKRIESDDDSTRLEQELDQLIQKCDADGKPELLELIGETEAALLFRQVDDLPQPDGDNFDISQWEEVDNLFQKLEGLESQRDSYDENKDNEQSRVFLTKARDKLENHKASLKQTQFRRRQELREQEGSYEPEINSLEDDLRNRLDTKYYSADQDLLDHLNNLPDEWKAALETGIGHLERDVSDLKDDNFEGDLESVKDRLQQQDQEVKSYPDLVDRVQKMKAELLLGELKNIDGTDTEAVRTLNNDFAILQTVGAGTRSREMDAMLKQIGDTLRRHQSESALEHLSDPEGFIKKRLGLSEEADSNFTNRSLSVDAGKIPRSQALEQQSVEQLVRELSSEKDPHAQADIIAKILSCPSTDIRHQKGLLAALESKLAALDAKDELDRGYLDKIRAGLGAKKDAVNKLTLSTLKRESTTSTVPQAPSATTSETGPQPEKGESSGIDVRGSVERSTGRILSNRSDIKSPTTQTRMSYAPAGSPRTNGSIQSRIADLAGMRQSHGSSQLISGIRSQQGELARAKTKQLPKTANFESPASLALGQPAKRRPPFDSTRELPKPRDLPERQLADELPASELLQCRPGSLGTTGTRQPSPHNPEHGQITSMNQQYPPIADAGIAQNRKDTSYAGVAKRMSNLVDVPREHKNSSGKEQKAPPEDDYDYEAEFTELLQQTLSRTEPDDIDECFDRLHENCPELYFQIRALKLLRKVRSTKADAPRADLTHSGYAELLMNDESVKASPVLSEIEKELRGRETNRHLTDTAVGQHQLLQSHPIERVCTQQPSRLNSARTQQPHSASIRRDQPGSDPAPLQQSAEVNFVTAPLTSDIRQITDDRVEAGIAVEPREKLEKAVESREELVADLEHALDIYEMCEGLQSELHNGNKNPEEIRSEIITMYKKLTGLCANPSNGAVQIREKLELLEEELAILPKLKKLEALGLDADGRRFRKQDLLNWRSELAKYANIFRKSPWEAKVQATEKLQQDVEKRLGEHDSISKLEPNGKEAVCTNPREIDEFVREIKTAGPRHKASLFELQNAIREAESSQRSLGERIAALEGNHDVALALKTQQERVEEWREQLNGGLKAELMRLKKAAQKGADISKTFQTLRSKFALQDHRDLVEEIKGIVGESNQNHWQAQSTNNVDRLRHLEGDVHRQVTRAEQVLHKTSSLPTTTRESPRITRTPAGGATFAELSSLVKKEVQRQSPKIHRSQSPSGHVRAGHPVKVFRKRGEHDFKSLYGRLRAPEINPMKVSNESVRKAQSIYDSLKGEVDRFKMRSRGSVDGENNCDMLDIRLTALKREVAGMRDQLFKDGNESRMALSPKSSRKISKDKPSGRRSYKSGDIGNVRSSSRVTPSQIDNAFARAGIPTRTQGRSERVARHGTFHRSIQQSSRAEKKRSRASSMLKELIREMDKSNRGFRDSQTRCLSTAQTNAFQRKIDEIKGILGDKISQSKLGEVNRLFAERKSRERRINEEISEIKNQTDGKRSRTTGQRGFL